MRDVYITEALNARETAAEVINQARGVQYRGGL
jgi:hypothetical protein